jgi:hypothetical protein
MSRPDLKDLLEEDLAQLRSGAGLEEVIARHPVQADRLRPLLEAARLAQSLDSNLSDMKIAQNRSRARFLGAARQRRERGRASIFARLTRMRMAGAAALIAIVLFASLVGASLSSVSAVPGQALYPVKRVVEQAQMALTTRQSSRLELEEAFDQRRMLEAEKLLNANRIQPVTFAGFLWEDPQQGWFVDRVKLILTPEQEAMAHALIGSYVEIKGVVRGGAGVEVTEMKLRLFHLDGEIERMEPGLWVVSGVAVQIQDSTQVIGNPRAGTYVELTALRLSGGQFLALSAKPGGKGSPQSGQEPDDRRSPKGKDIETPQPESKGTEEIPGETDAASPVVTLEPSRPDGDDLEITIDKDSCFSCSKKKTDEDRAEASETESVESESGVEESPATLQPSVVSD